MKNLLFSFVILILSCGSSGSSNSNSNSGSGSSDGNAAAKSAQSQREEPRFYKYQVVKIYPHSTDAYTQGLYFHEGFLYEGTGLYGESYLRKVDLETGKVLKEIKLPDEFFGEGIALVGDKIYQLTWKNNRAFVYDARTFEKIGQFGYSGEGWGLTTDGKMLYMSDGSQKIRVIDPATFKSVRTIEVYSDRGKVMYLNELEWIEGEIWANIYQSNLIVKIDPETGTVKGVVNMEGLLNQSDITPDTDVLNGIAYDAQNKRIFVTGKKWNKLFEIEVKLEPQKK